jgi:hypothetical protein
MAAKDKAGCLPNPRLPPSVVILPGAHDVAASRFLVALRESLRTSGSLSVQTSEAVPLLP